MQSCALADLLIRRYIRYIIESYDSRTIGRVFTVHSQYRCLKGHDSIARRVGFKTAYNVFSTGQRLKHV